MMKIGFVINPLAGIGGTVALKGSDGEAIVAQALALGGQPQAQIRAKLAIDKLTQDECTFYTASGDMGETVLSASGASFDVLYSPPESPGTSTAEDTRLAVQCFIDRQVDLIVFAGGDGTARDVLDAFSERAGVDIPVIGIPAGVKIHSAVYATTPSQAGELIQLIITGEPMSLSDAKVMDLDEEAFRSGQVTARCYGYLKVPVDDTRMQLIKQGGVDHHQIAIQEIAEDIVDSMEDDVLYLIGSGSTTAAIMEVLGLDNTLLGIDIVCNRQLLQRDVDERAILRAISGRDARVVVTIIGGQGHIFGRGNQQLSAEVIRRAGPENIIIVASNEKLRSLDNRPMLTDTGDADLDQELAGLRQVVTGYQQKTLYRLN